MIKPLSEDGTTALSTVWTSDDATESVVRDVAAMREVRPDWAYVTGEAGFAADQAAALEGIDETLLIATLILVLVLLLLIYRSPVIALVPLLVVGIAYLVAAGVVYAGAQAGPLPGHRPGDRDPDRADVRRGHGLLPAAARPLPGGAGDRHAGPDGHRAAPHRAGDRLRGRDRRRGDARAHARRLQRHALDGPGAGHRHRDHRARRRHAPARRARRAAAARVHAQEADRPDLAADRRARPPPPGDARHRRRRACSSPARSATSRSRARSTSASSSGRRRSPSRACASCRPSSRPASPARWTCSSRRRSPPATTSRQLGMDLAQSVDLRRVLARRQARAHPHHAAAGPVHRAGDGGHPAPAREREASSARRP